MNEPEDAFVERRTTDWQGLEGLLRQGQAWHRLQGQTLSQAAALYRSVAADLMHVRTAGYTPELVAFLDGLAARAHSALYSAAPYRIGAAGDLLLRDFPRTLRKHRRAFAIATALFLLPFIAGLVGAMSSRRFALEVLPEDQALMAEEMYAHPTNEGRTQGVNAAMAGYYIQHNIGLAFQCFATGILFGLGSVFFLVVNGLQIGVFLGVVIAAGHARNILPFVCGHGAFELTAIVIAGTAGLVMGYALIETDGLRRWDSLRRRTPELAQLILGATCFLAVAAGLEGFWSPSAVPASLKYGAALVLWCLVAAYLILAGRGPRALGGDST